ncbi:EVE domain-containing protein [Simiduia curdlanivorans]|uniref:EVE domain-containing protein n=1 Tax=Simiduia curdlanivorans TaxID=1492769 RepID=A0ABV8V3D4_9GAMM|nr:EVE domain-containing protein [Simiduia curdlanivorans]MDN3637613.1 EVE domain-containing protein [Simiduia curdlanivorans]
MNYWLFKTEPDDISLDDIKAAKTKGLRWDGIRNFQARNFLRDQLAVGDGVFIYHSQCKTVGIVGTAEVTRAAYADPAQFDKDSKYFDAKATTDVPRWFCVDIRYTGTLKKPLLLSQLKADPRLSDMVLIKQGRLSIQPVTQQEWRYLHTLAQTETES